MSWLGVLKRNGPAGPQWQADGIPSMNCEMARQHGEMQIPTSVDYAICMLDRDGIVISWSNGAEQLTGYRAGDIVGRPLDLLYSDDDRLANALGRDLRVASEHGSHGLDALHRRHDGSRFDIIGSIQALADGAGALTGFAVVMHDLRQRRHVEQRLRDAELCFQLFVDGVSDCAICMLDADGRVIDWNDGAARLTGYSETEIVGCAMAQFFLAAEHAHYALSVTRDAGLHQLKDWVQRKDGSRFLADVTLSAIHNADARLLGFAMVTRNITATRHAEQRLEEIRAQLFQTQKVAALGQLTTGIAHDFNNMLQGIIGSLDVIELRLARGNVQDISRFLSHASSSAERAAKLIHRLLAFARQGPEACGPVDVNALIESMTTLLHPTLGRIELALNLGDDLPLALCDPNQLENAILNLAINARDAMTSGGRLVIRTRLVLPMDADHGGIDSTAPMLCLQLADNGPGMAPEARANAFEPFFTTKPKGLGTGLGLAMVHDFVVEARGRIELASEPGRGTVVTIQLPCQERRAVERVPLGVPTHEPHSDDALALPASSGASILLVEDEGGLREQLGERLRDLGYRVLEAPDGLSGLAALDTAGTIDLIICDIGLPGMDGLEMVETMRQRCPEQKVLFVTGRADETLHPDTRTVVLPKPFRFGTLIAQIDHLMRVAPPPGP